MLGTPRQNVSGGHGGSRRACASQDHWHEWRAGIQTALNAEKLMLDEKTTLDSLIVEINSLTERMMHEEPQEIFDLRHGEMDNKAGSYGQYFGTWDIAHGMLRDYSMYTMYPLVALAEDPEMKVDQVGRALSALDPAYSNYLRYSGFPTMGSLANELRPL